MYPQRYLDYLIHFHGDRDYFECHEVLEEQWKSESAPDPVWVGLIQLAVGLYHQRRGNFAGAQKMFTSSLSILQQMPERLHSLGIDSTKLYHQLTLLVQAVQEQKPYQSINLPMIDPAIVKACEDGCRQLGMPYGELHNRPSDAILHKHKLRDREDVIREREQQLERKRQNRSS